MARKANKFETGRNTTLIVIITETIGYEITVKDKFFRFLFPSGEYSEQLRLSTEAKALLESQFRT